MFLWLSNRIFLHFSPQFLVFDYLISHFRTVKTRSNELPRDWENVFVIQGFSPLTVVLLISLTGLKNVVRNTGEFVMKGFVISEFHCNSCVKTLKSKKNCSPFLQCQMPYHPSHLHKG